MAAIKRYGILDTPPERAYDRITALAAQLMGTPMAIVSIVDADRIWFKSRHGVDVDEVERDPGFCASAILQDEPWVIEDAPSDPRARANPLVAGELGLRSYAGVQLRTHDGHNLGTLGVLDRTPRTFTRAQVKVLQGLAQVVVQELEVRFAARRAVRAIAEELGRSTEPELAEDVPQITLTEREHEVLEALAAGLTNREIAVRLSVSQATVKSHVGNIFGKLDVKNRAQAAVYGARRERRS